MKTEKEIREEIRTIEREIDNYHNAYNEGAIPFSILRNVIQQNGAMVSALKWVLGENERYD